MTDLAKKVVLSEHFELMDGMRLASIETPQAHIRVEADAVDKRRFEELPDGTFKLGTFTWTLDTSDPATKGCLLHLVRKTWDEPKLSVEWDECVGDDGTWCAGGPQYSIGESSTEEETLCLALLAAPEKS